MYHAFPPFNPQNSHAIFFLEGGVGGGGGIFHMYGSTCQIRTSVRYSIFCCAFIDVLSHREYCI